MTNAPPGTSFRSFLAGQSLPDRRHKIALATLVVLSAAAALGYHPSLALLVGLLAIPPAFAIFRRPVLGLLLVVPAALLAPVPIPTGTEVKLNLVALLLPALFLVMLFTTTRARGVHVARSSMNLPLVLFIGGMLLSLLIGRATWDTKVPVAPSFLMVQLAQWAIFVLSGMAFWLTANLITDEAWLRRLTHGFLIVGGGFGILLVVVTASSTLDRVATMAFIRPPLWIMLSALAGGQLLFNRRLSRLWFAFLIVVLFASVWHSFVQFQEAVSHWLGCLVVLGTLFWLRFPRLRWVTLAIVVLSLALGFLAPALYNFAGGDAEWTMSGGSRIVLTQRVIDVTLRNPITGLGPAAYRVYARMTPLPYSGAYWQEPQVNSHNNYVDLFAHGGIVSLALFAWFAWEAGRTGIRLRARLTSGFAAGYTNAVLAAGAASLVIMAFADWILPFVYNIGYDGFQASVFVWLFAGGLVSVTQFTRPRAVSASLAPSDE